MPTPAFSRRRFADLPGWEACDHALAFQCFRRSAARFLDGDAKTGTLGVDAGAFGPAARDAQEATTGSDPRGFFERHFVPVFVAASTDDPNKQGFCTAYYEPVVDARLQPDERFRFPLYRPPADLVKVDDVSRPAGLDPYFRFAQRRADGILGEYPDRAAIERGALAGRGLEIAWLADPVDAFFIHVQGSARLRLPDGASLRVTYAAKTGHRFTAVGRVLVETGELTLPQADMDGIRAWLERHPDRLRSLFDHNRSFIFFREAAVEDEALGPVAAAKVPLTPLASIAVDRELHTFGTPFFIDAPTLEMEGRPLRRLFVAQDTGSAILGPARADIFVGSGEAAGAIAGRVRHAGDFYALVPLALADTLAP